MNYETELFNEDAQLMVCLHGQATFFVKEDLVAPETEITIEDFGIMAVEALAEKYEEETGADAEFDTASWHYYPKQENN